MRRAPELNLSGYFLLEIPNPKKLAKQDQLIRVKLANNYLPKLPDVFVKLDQVHTIILTSNQFTEIPPQLYSMDRLRRLDLS